MGSPSFLRPGLKESRGGLRKVGLESSLRALALGLTVLALLGWKLELLIVL